jgi:hypothetical protein
MRHQLVLVIDIFLVASSFRIPLHWYGNAYKCVIILTLHGDCLTMFLFRQPAAVIHSAVILSSQPNGADQYGGQPFPSSCHWDRTLYFCGEISLKHRTVKILVGQFLVHVVT